MLLHHLVPFLQVAIATLHPKLLIFYGDHSTLPQLIQVRQRLSTRLPSVLFSMSSSIDPQSNISNFCLDCPTSQLSLISVSSYAHLAAVKNIFHPRYIDTNRIVLLATKTVRLADQVHMFSLYNLVLVDYAEQRGSAVGYLKVMAWVRYVDGGNRVVNVFNGTKLFASHNPDALLYRKQLQRWPAEPPIAGVFINIMMAPYNFIVRDEQSGDGDGKLWLASASMTLFQMIGDALRYRVRAHFLARPMCPDCFEPLPMRSNRGRVPLFDHDEVVLVVLRQQPLERGLIVSQEGSFGHDSRQYEIRRYVAIVPYRTERHHGTWTIEHSMLNAAVLTVWLCGALIFAALRIGMRRIVVASAARSGTANHFTIVLKCLSAVLGNSAGPDHCVGPSESWVLFVCGVFAVLTSNLMTGALFEQLLAVEPPRQIETMAELAASNLTIYECWGEHEALKRSGPNPSLVQTPHFASVGRIELCLLKHETRFAYVLPESIADVVHHPALRYANGTPVFHIVAEPYRISSQFISMLPMMMQTRVLALWTRLIESGINEHVQRQTADLYKAARSEWFRRQPEIERPPTDEDATSGWSDVMLLVLVLGIGHSAAAVVFLMELVGGHINWNV